MQRILILTTGILVTAAACTGSVPGDENAPDAEGPPRVSGVLFVERAQDGATASAQVGARFLRVTGVNDDALPDLAGVPAVPTGVGCVERGAPLRVADPSRAEVRLLDVGPIEVHAEDRVLRMAPRRFPDLWNVVSGSLYGMEADLPSGTWRFTGSGDMASGVGAFDVQAQCPEAPAGVRLGDVTLPLEADGRVALPRRGGLSVRWSRGGDVDDRIAVVFEGAGSVVCGARDEGAFDIDAATMDRVRELLHAGGSVSVHRLRTRPFMTTGIDHGALVFDLSMRAHVGE